MAHARIFCKALKITKLKKKLIQDKRHAFSTQHGKRHKFTVNQKCRHCLIDCREKLKTKVLTFPENSCLHRFCFNLRHYGSIENYILKSIFGFLSGFVLTYIFFMFFVVQLNFKLSTATIMCSILGCILMVGLAFSCYVRCIVLLTLPQFFSKRGRQALLAYAFILAITGPAKNTLNNMQILSESLACGQEQLKYAVKQIVDVIKKPFYAIKDAIKTVVKTVKVIVKKIKEILIQIKRIIIAIVKVIKAAFAFLGKILNICNKKLGTPFERCARVFDNAILDCNAKLGPFFNWLCSITYLIKSVCYIVKIFDVVCLLVDFVSDSIIGVVFRKIKTFMRHVRTMFYVRIKFSHSFHFQTNSSKSLADVAHGIVTEIKDRSQVVLVVFEYISFATSFFFLFIIIKVIQYRYKFLTSEPFDNKYITEEFREIDMTRAKLGRETVLPLNHRERKMYITMSSKRLVKAEKKKLAKSGMILGIATLKLGSHMMIDYLLYWILELIRYHGRFQSKVEAPNMPSLHIVGEGLLADLLKSVVKAFKPIGVNLEVDTVPCLPTPLPPDYDRYIQIGTLLILCWFFTIFEPYGLRFRHWIMCYYHPLRAKQRSIWLYNHIMRTRFSFLKFARRQLKRKITGARNIAHITFKEWLRAQLDCKICNIILGSPKQQIACLLCGEIIHESDKSIKCQNPGCPGIYCLECFKDLQNLCTVCLAPMEYGDLSDISLEMGSSEEKSETAISRIVKKTKSLPKGVKETSFIELGLNEEEKLIKDETDATSTDYSSDYQYEDDVADTKIETIAMPRGDEQWDFPDYASMESFRGSLTRFSKATNTDLKKSVATSISNLHFS